MTGFILLAARAWWLTSWLTPLWLLGLGCAVGLLLLGAVWGICLAVVPAMGVWLQRTVREGPLFPVLITTGALATFAILATPIIPEPQAMLQSLGRVPATGTTTKSIAVEPPAGAEAVGGVHDAEIPFAFRVNELQKVSIKSNVNVTVSALPERRPLRGAQFEVIADETLNWFPRNRGASPFPDEAVEKFYIWNNEEIAANVELTVETAPIYPQMMTVPLTAMWVVLGFAAYIGFTLALPKVAAVALATAKNELAHPLFLLLCCGGSFLLMLFILIPYNTFGEDIKMLKDTGLTLIMVLAIINSLWAAGNSVSEEIEGRTALTVLSKPIGRRQFVLGKFAGIVCFVAVMFVILGTVFLTTVAYKPVYDSRETSREIPEWDECHREMVSVVPGLALAFMETVVLAALGVAISTRLPMLANFVIVVSIYALGHLTPLIVNSSEAQGQFVNVVFVGRLLAAVLPVLDYFSVQAAIAGDRPVPYEYLATTLIYCVLYSCMAMLLALALFEDRDLA